MLERQSPYIVYLLIFFAIMVTWRCMPLVILLCLISAVLLILSDSIAAFKTSTILAKLPQNREEAEGIGDGETLMRLILDAQCIRIPIACLYMRILSIPVVYILLIVCAFECSMDPLKDYFDLYVRPGWVYTGKAVMLLKELYYIDILHEKES